MFLRRLVSVAFAVTCALSLSSLATPKALAQSDPKAEDPRKAVKDAYTLQDTSLTSKNFQGFLSLYAPDCTLQDPKGHELKLNQFKSQFAILALAGREIKSTTTVESLTPAGDKIKSKVKQHVNGVVVNPRDKTPIQHKFVLDAVSIDTWQKRPRGWKKVNCKYIKYAATIDGEPLSKILEEHKSEIQGGKAGGK